MVINGTNLKSGIVQNNIAADNGHSVTAKSVLQSAFGAQFETTRDSYVHRGYAMCGIEDITYSKEDKSKKSAADESTTSVLDSIKEMTAQLDTIVNQIDGLGYNEVRELFGISDDSDVKGIVTVVEKIQIKLAAALGEDYKGGMSFSSAEAEAVTGSKLTANAVADNLNTYNLPVTKENEEQIYAAMETLEKVKSITKEHAQYLVKNDLEPTIANIYKAQNSAGSVYDGIRLTDADWEQLKPQVAEIVKDTFGETDNQEYLLETARWMVEHDIELNQANLLKFTAIESIDAENISIDTAARWMTQAIAMGKTADAANLTPVEYTGAYVEDIVKRRQLEEIRLLMTKEAGLMLMKKGIDIDTTDLEKLVEELKAQETEYFKNLGKLVDAELSDDDIGIYKETVGAIEFLKVGPAYIVGGAVRGDFETTVAGSAEASKNMLSMMAADKAEAAYEALMTRPEREYGDSISKAFRNIDVLLKDIGLEDTAENNRAVRILAYNEMEISAENVEAVKAEDNEYQYLLKNMTPRMVLHLISKGINPLDIDIHELNDRLEDMKDEVSETKEERFSEFLWRLDKSGQISEEDREAYLGIYRLLNTINRADGAAIGALVNQGAEVTLNNLLTAARSRKHKGMDVKLDEDLSFIAKAASDNSITEQLKFFYDNSWKAEYEEYKKEEYKALASDEEALRLIAEEGQEPTLNMIKAAGLLAAQNGAFYEKYLKLPKTSAEPKEEADKKKEKLNKLTEALGDREALTEGFESLGETVSKMLETYAEETAVGYDTLEDLRILAAGFKFLTASAKNNESYQVPLEISGNMTNVHLKVVRGMGQDGLVRIEFNDEKYGKVRAEFKVKGNVLEGFIVSDSRSGIDSLKTLEADFAERMGGYNISLKRIDYAVSFFTQNTTGLSSEEKPEAENKVATKILYGVAKEFLLQLN